MNRDFEDNLQSPMLLQKLHKDQNLDTVISTVDVVAAGQ